MVVAAGVLAVVAATAVGTHGCAGLLGILQLHAAQSLIVTDSAVPVGTELALAALVGARHVPAGAHGAAAVGVIIGSPGQSVGSHAAEVQRCNVLQSGSNAVVHIGKEVVALCQAHLADVERQSQRHERVALVATALLHLSEVAQGASRVGMHHGHEVSDELVAAVVEDHALRRAVLEGSHVVVFVEGDALVIHVHIVAQDADRGHAQGVAQAPVAPVVARALAKVGVAEVGPRVVAAAQEVDGGVVEHAHNPAAEGIEVLAAPALVVAHELCCVGPFVAVDTCGKRDVGVAAQAVAPTHPLHHDAHGGIGILTRAPDFPAKGILVGHGSTAGTVHVVLSAAATTNNGPRRPRGNGGTGVFVGAEDFPGPLDALVAVGQQLLGAVDVLLRHDAAGMHKAIIIVCRKHVLGLVALGCLGLRQLAGQRGNILVDEQLRCPCRRKFPRGQRHHVL